MISVTVQFSHGDVNRPYGRSVNRVLTCLLLMDGLSRARGDPGWAVVKTHVSFVVRLGKHRPAETSQDGS